VVVFIPRHLRVWLVKRFFGIILIGGVFLTLCGLSAWQLQRREWKSQLLETLAANSIKPPLPLADVLPLPDDQQWYRPVTLEGTLLWDKSLRVGLRQQNGQAGYWIVTPMRLDEGHAFVVTGFVTLSASASWVSPTPSFLRLTARPLPNTARTWFTPENQPDKGIWYTLYVAEMASFLGLKPFLPMAFVTDGVPGLTTAAATPTLRNDHLQYAITWALLAIALVIFTIFYSRRS
jgi:surfeit locus 1 family protein